MNPDKQEISRNTNIANLTKKYEKLLSEIKLHDRLYYKENSPKISDFEYDCLKAEAERLHELLATYSPAISDIVIGDDRSQKFPTFQHLSPMLSLSNTYSQEELFQFDTRTKALLGSTNIAYVVEPKIDGVAINLIYRCGRFFKAVTRGDGMIGDDVTANAQTIENLPIEIDDSSDEIEIRGEIYIDKQRFLEINQSREEMGLENFSNPRNLAAGTLKTLDVKEVADRKLQLIVYGIGYYSGYGLLRQGEVLRKLAALGFRSQDKFWVVNDIASAWQRVKEIGELRHAFPYWIDGAVLKIDNLLLHKTIGTTSKSPRWAIAYKFPPERANSVVNDITLQVGRTGIITPVAELKNVVLAGTNVSRATLHNADEIARKDIRIGDHVVIEKAGEIIPAIIGVDIDKRQSASKAFVFSRTCPACGAQLIKLPDEVAWRCQNLTCPPQIQRRLEHFVSKSAMAIDGLGSVFIAKLIAENKLHDITDLYKLTFSDLENLDKFGTKLALKALDNIETSKNNPLWRLLHGLGICGVGEQTAKVLAKRFLFLERLACARQEELETIDGVGPKLSSAIIGFFSNQNNAKIIQFLQEMRIGTREPLQVKAQHVNFSGKRFVVTGTLRALTREELINKIESFGGIIMSSVSRATNVLIAGDNPGSKLSMAMEIGTEVWDEKTLFDRIQEADD